LLLHAAHFKVKNMENLLLQVSNTYIPKMVVAPH